MRAHEWDEKWEMEKVRGEERRIKYTTRFIEGKRGRIQENKTERKQEEGDEVRIATKGGEGGEQNKDDKTKDVSSK